MALEVEHQYRTHSRNVVLRDTSVEFYRGVDVRSCEGVQFDVHLMSDGGSREPFLDLQLEGFRGVVEVLKYYSVDDDSDITLELVVIPFSGVTFRHVVDPSRFDVTLKESWDNLALDVVEWLMGRGVSSEVSSPVVRRSRYGREPLL